MRPLRLATLLLACFGLAASCTPAQRQAAAPAAREACELAPILLELLARTEPGEGVTVSTIGDLGAPDAGRRSPRRRCVSWESLDAGADGGR